MKTPKTKFLDGPAAQSDIIRLIAKSERIELAVAFWGQPAPETLGLIARKREHLRVVCNLKMGGTNPAAVEALLDAGVNVMQSDKLHGKIYLFDDTAVLGSSNASANGLSLQGDDWEFLGWDEANIRTNDEKVIADIRTWFENLPKRKIKPKDLELAHEAWSRRRKAGLKTSMTSRKMLIDDLRADSRKFEGRRDYVCVYSEPLSKRGEKSLSFAKQSYGKAEGSDHVDGFEWDNLPDFANLLCFWREENGTFTSEGIYKMPQKRIEITKFGTRFQVCFETNSIAGYPQSRVGSAKQWTPALKRLLKDSDDPGAAVLDLGEFGEKYITA